LKNRAPAPWPADKIERWPLARLVPYARNARTHSEAQIAQIAASMREFGWTMPVLCDEAGTIIAGHGRVLAARLLNYSEAPVMIARGWTESQRRAYTLADNQLATKAGWDNSLLALELDDLRAGGVDLALLGFETADLEAVFGSGAPGHSGAGNLADKFGIPPFSVLSARGGWWQGRKDAWIALGIQSELGRGDASLSTDARNALPGGSLMPSMMQTHKTGKVTRGDSRGRPIPATGANIGAR
jgi:ParB-like nuclease domain